MFYTRKIRRNLNKTIETLLFKVDDLEFELWKVKNPPIYKYGDIVESTLIGVGDNYKTVRILEVSCIKKKNFADIVLFEWRYTVDVVDLGIFKNVSEPAIRKKQQCIEDTPSDITVVPLKDKKRK